MKIDGPFRSADDLELATLLIEENEYCREMSPRASWRRENPPSTKPGAI